jgi:hypothetical protein
MLHVRVPPLKSPELGAVLVTEKNRAYVPLRRRGLALISVSRGRSSGSKAGLSPVPGARGPALHLVVSEAAPGPRRCAATKKKVLPFPHHGSAPQNGEAPAHVGGLGLGIGSLFCPHADLASATRAKKQLTPGYNHICTPGSRPSSEVVFLVCGCFSGYQ